MSLAVKNAAIKSSLFLDYAFERTDGEIKNIIKTNSDAPIHDDLRNAFRALIPHFCFISEQITDKELVEQCIDNVSDYIGDREKVVKPDFLKFNVNSFAMSKSGEGVIISGSRQLDTFDEIGWSTPLIKFDSDYPFASALEMAIENLKEEVQHYMSGKQAAKAQLDMFESQDDEENEGI